MMNNSQNSPTCKFDGCLVSYIYEEMGAGERTAFESHLVDCTICTDEFAEVAHARFAVYEWHAEEFVPLATPVIDIPYRQTADAVARSGFFAGVRELFALSRWPVTVAAMLTIAPGAGLFGILFFDGGEQQITADLEPAAIVQEPPRNVQAPASKSEPAVKVNPASPQPEKREVRKPKRTIEIKRISPKRELPAETGTVAVNRPTQRERTTALRTNSLPVLNSYEDIDDRSLRLADLVDGGGNLR